MKRIGVVAVVLAAGALVVAGDDLPYDLLVTGGRVLDPGSGLDGQLDVAVAGGRVARVEPGIPESSARVVVRAAGRLVTPGLVDLQAHVYAGSRRLRGESAVRGGLSVEADAHLLPAGVTTVVDAGSCGCDTFMDFKNRVVDLSAVRVLVLLNVVRDGMTGEAAGQKPDRMDVECIRDLARRFPDLVVGVEVAGYRQPDAVAFRRALDAVAPLGLPVVVSAGGDWPARRPYEQVLGQLRRGDVVSRPYDSAVPLVTGRKGEPRVAAAFLDARRRGVLFDLGQGAGRFSWRAAEAAARLGFWPDTISSGLDAHSVRGGAGRGDLPTALAALVDLGLPLADAIRRATEAPARVVGRRELGRLSPGSAADLAIWRLHSGGGPIRDARGVTRTVALRLECEATIRDGRVVWQR